MNSYKLIPAALAVATGMAQTTPAPSLLSRGSPPHIGATRAERIFRPSLGAFSGYDDGPFTTGLARAGGPFQELAGRLEGRRPGKRINLRLDYQFGLRHYTRASRLDRSHHAIYLEGRFQVSRRFTLMLREVGSSSSFGDSFLATQPELIPGFFVDGGPEVFHSRTVLNSALADLVFSPSVRTSVSVGADGFLVQRQSHALIDAAGWRARADLAHRYARHKTVSLCYSFTHFEHSRSFGGADYAVYAAGHSVRLSNNSEITLLGGAGRLRSAGVRAVELDPDIAKILGTSRGAEIFRLNTWMPHLMAAWVQGIGRAEVRLQLARVVSDGGGLTGLARQNYGTFTVRPWRGGAWRPSAHLVARTYRSLDTLLYNNTTALAGAAITRRLTTRSEAVVRYHYAFYNFQRGLLHNFRRHEIAAGVIYTFAPPRGGRRSG